MQQIIKSSKSAIVQGIAVRAYRHVARRSSSRQRVHADDRKVGATTVPAVRLCRTWQLT